MTDTRPNYHNHVYASFVVLGIIIVAAAIYMSSTKIDFFEHNTNRIHRLITASELELDTLEREAATIEKTLQELSDKIGDKPEANVKLTRQFLELKESINRLRSDIAEKQKLLISLNLLKTSTLTQIKTLFWVNSGLIVIGALMILLGGAAIGFRLEIFQDRRKRKRSAETA